MTQHRNDITFARGRGFQQTLNLSGRTGNRERFFQSRCSGHRLLISLSFIGSVA
jgi:hypothetical protein